MKKVIVNRTTEDIRMFRGYFLAFVEAKSLPDEIADLFDVELVVIDNEYRICVDFKDD